MTYDRSLETASASVEESARRDDVAHESPYLTAAEAARYLRYESVKALYDAVPKLDIPVCRRGSKTMLFDRRDLDRWLHNEGRRRKRRAQKPVARALNLVHDATSVAPVETER